MEGILSPLGDGGLCSWMHAITESLVYEALFVARVTQFKQFDVRDNAFMTSHYSMRSAIRRLNCLRIRLSSRRLSRVSFHSIAPVLERVHS